MKTIFIDTHKNEKINCLILDRSESLIITVQINRRDGTLQNTEVLSQPKGVTEYIHE